MEFCRQDYWSKIPFPSGNLPNPEIEPESLVAPALASRFFNTCPTWEALKIDRNLFLNTEIEGYSKYDFFKKSVNNGESGYTGILCTIREIFCKS